MQQQCLLREPSPRAANDQRSQSRTSLFIRPVKLIAEEGEFLCIIRDISDSGISLRSYHEMPAFRTASLQLETGETFRVDLVWQKDCDAGFRFLDKINVEAIIAETGAYPKRPLRFFLEAQVDLYCKGMRHRAQITDLSQQGARLHSQLTLSLGELVRIEHDFFPPIVAKVCWRKGEEHGLIFENRFSMKELAAVAARFQRPELLSMRA